MRGYYVLFSLNYFIQRQNSVEVRARVTVSLDEMRKTDGRGPTGWRAPRSVLPRSRDCHCESLRERERISFADTSPRIAMGGEPPSIDVLESEKFDAAHMFCFGNPFVRMSAAISSVDTC